MGPAIFSLSLLWAPCYGPCYGPLYRERHRIENLFVRLKSFRRIATRYEKLHATFASMFSIACILIWLKF